MSGAALRIDRYRIDAGLGWIDALVDSRAELTGRFVAFVRGCGYFVFVDGWNAESALIEKDYPLGSTHAKRLCPKGLAAPCDLTLTLTLTHEWYDETVSGRKRVEYRDMSPHWRRLIWERRHRIARVRFFRAMSKESALFSVAEIDVGPCSLGGWSGEYYRIAFEPMEGGAK